MAKIRMAYVVYLEDVKREDLEVFLKLADRYGGILKFASEGAPDTYVDMIVKGLLEADGFVRELERLKAIEASEELMKAMDEAGELEDPELLEE